MFELFKTTLILSIFGFGITAVLICFKPITSKKFPAVWQYYVWVAVLFSMIIPAYKLIPKKEARKIPFITQVQSGVQETAAKDIQNDEAAIIEKTPIEHKEINLTRKYRIRISDLAAYIWFFGICIFLITIITSYIMYIVRKRKNSLDLEGGALLDEVRNELNIKRRIKIRMSKDLGSPMLVGIIFPVIYIPIREISDENMRMVFLHELTHYKRKDLLIKWFSIFVNAIHWFNPLCYLLCANISEACEISCDMTVTKNMSDIEQKLYMKTILDLLQERRMKFNA